MCGLADSMAGEEQDGITLHPTRRNQTFGDNSEDAFARSDTIGTRTCTHTSCILGSILLSSWPYLWLYPRLALLLCCFLCIHERVRSLAMNCTLGVLLRKEQKGGKLTVRERVFLILADPSTSRCAAAFGFVQWFVIILSSLAYVYPSRN